MNRAALQFKSLAEILCESDSEDSWPALDWAQGIGANLLSALVKIAFDKLRRYSEPDC